ncbi:DUF4164 family protein [Cyanobacterium aponinum FACHB-4101]|uniref:DUF4164 family protein n=1 Tax=Cyanobacterium aponinum TaxID=379064 RepID=UPI001681687B|nr:DUF4164 family protein [Cyanobacterium aponinum]MBD2395681.1 DUF4164 family protein [Cyanobacterium aponinum FACHB-4101]
MNQIIEVNIAELLSRLETKIDSLDKKFENKLDKLENKVDKLDEKIDHLSERMAGVEGKLDGFNKRIENLEFIARTVGGGIIVALLLGLTKILFPNLTL